MNDPQHHLLEQELRRLRPAAPPAEVMERLLSLSRGHRDVESSGFRSSSFSSDSSSSSFSSSSSKFGQKARGRFMQRLAPHRSNDSAPFWPLFLRWLVPATAVLVAAVVLWRVPLSRTPETARQQTADASPAVKADDVEIQQELVKSFDTVAVLPSGEPVRFRCREWFDEVTLRDKRSGFMIEQRTPRVEVIPVRFETY